MMIHPGSGPASSGDHLHQAVHDLYAVRNFLEAPFQLPANDWQEAYDGLGHVVLAAERLAATLKTRCPTDPVAELDAVHDLLREAKELLTRTKPLPG
jgi:hypothetical protein